VRGAWRGRVPRGAASHVPLTTNEGVQCLLEVTDRCRQTPCSELGAETTQPRERELGLDTSLRPHQLMPLVDDDETKRPEQLGRLWSRQQQR
jgi:hypothetical protein